MQKQDGSQQATPTPPTKVGRGAGLSALLDWLRSLPVRLRRPETLLMLMAILASLGAHMPPYISLGALADYFKAHPPLRPAAPPVEVSFEVDAPADPQPEDPEPDEAAEPERAPKDKPEPEKHAELVPEKKAEPEAPKPELKVSEVTVQPAPPPPPPSQERKQSVTQKSEDPNIEPPPDAKFLAEESRRVEEETVAMLRDQNHDDPLPQPSAPQAAGPEESGDARDDQRGELGGADEPAPREPAVAMRESAASPPQTPTEAARPPAPRPAPPSQAPAPAIAPGTIIQDPLGSFVLAPANPAQRSQASQRATRPSSAPTGAANAPDLRVSWRAFEDTFGAEQLAKDRMPPGAKRRGAGREKRWSEFRAAIENYITGVKPGNTTALNAAADPFAAYLAAFHRNLHIEFAHEFLGSLPAFGTLGNPNLVARVEIVVNPDGTLDRVGIVKSSGELMYDFGAFNAVQRGAPYPPPPEKIRSPDGRAYIQWALHRNESQCGTWNAEPFMLRDPPRSPNDPPRDNVTPFRNLLSPSEGEHGRAPARTPRHEGGATLPGDTLGLAPSTRLRIPG